MRRPFVVSLLVHVALAAAAATVWQTHVARPSSAVVLVVSPADHPPAPDPPLEPPPRPAAPSFDETEIPFPEPVAAPDAPPFVAPPAPRPRMRTAPRVLRLGCSLRPAPAPAPPRPTPPPTHRVKPPPPRPAKVLGPTRGPALLRSDARAPEYPRQARRRGHEGRVVLRIHVAADGAVARVEVETSSGFPSLDKAAARAAKRWRFRPALVDGRPVEATVRRSVRFRLDG